MKDRRMRQINDIILNRLIIIYCSIYIFNIRMVTSVFTIIIINNPLSLIICCNFDARWNTEACVSFDNGKNHTAVEILKSMNITPRDSVVEFWEWVLCKNIMFDNVMIKLSSSRKCFFVYIFCICNCNLYDHYKCHYIIQNYFYIQIYRKIVVVQKGFKIGYS